MTTIREGRRMVSLLGYAALLAFTAATGCAIAQELGRRAPMMVDPTVPDKLASADIPLPTCPLEKYGYKEPEKITPIVNVDDFGAKGDGVTDDSDAIIAAIASLKTRGTIVFTPGKTYAKTKGFVLAVPGVRVWGYGAKMFSIVTAEQIRAGKNAVQLGFQLKAPDTAVYGLTIFSNLRSRLVGAMGNGAIQVTGPRQQVVDNRIEYTGNGVLVREGTDFLVARNVVFRSTSDGIHTTTRSKHGRVACNIVRENGDDMIAVVSYGIGDPNVGDVLIEDNDVAGQYWGRGITVVGGYDVTIRNNKVDKTTHGAAILVASDKSFKTSNVKNVVVEGNTITDVQNTDPAYNPRGEFNRVNQGAIDVFAPKGQSVESVVIRNNSIARAKSDGIYVHGEVCGIGLESNQLKDVSGVPIRIASDQSDSCYVACRGNSKNGSSVDDKQCRSEMPHATGSTF